jgi:hypothetical protein
MYDSGNQIEETSTNCHLTSYVSLVGKADLLTYIYICRIKQYRIFLPQRRNIMELFIIACPKEQILGGQKYIQSDY